MADYIEREDAIEEIANNPVTMSVCLSVDEAKGRREERDIAIESIKRIPAADVVEVVRCKDCANNYGTKDAPWCDFTDSRLSPNSYCSCGWIKMEAE